MWRTLVNKDRRKIYNWRPTWDPGKLKIVGGGELSKRKSSEQNHTTEEAATGCYRVNHPSITKYDRATGKVSGSYTPGVSAKQVKTVG